MAQKKVRALPPLAATLRSAPVGPPVLELDELWSFVGSKQRPAWVWVPLCCSTPRSSLAVRDRSEESCRYLWEQVPEPWRKATGYTDFWDAYGAVLPATQHEIGGKRDGQTAHIERWNNTLRQRLGARLCVKRCRFRNPTGCTRRVCASSCSVTTRALRSPRVRPLPTLEDLNLPL